MATPVCSGGPCDTLMVFPNADHTFFPVVDAVTLSNGGTVLGSVSGVYAPVFASAGSAIGPGLAAIVDFSSILDGTINGSLSFSLLSGSMTWNGSPNLSLVLGRALAPGLVVEGSAVVITGVSIFGPPRLSPESLEPENMVHNPEPGSLWLALGGGATLWVLRRYSGRWRRRR